MQMKSSIQPANSTASVEIFVNFRTLHRFTKAIMNLHHCFLSSLFDKASPQLCNNDGMSERAINYFLFVHRNYILLSTYSLYNDSILSVDHALSVLKFQGQNGTIIV